MSAFSDLHTDHQGRIPASLVEAWLDVQLGDVLALGDQQWALEFWRRLGGVEVNSMPALRARLLEVWAEVLEDADAEVTSRSFNLSLHGRRRSFSQFETQLMERRIYRHLQRVTSGEITQSPKP